MHEVAVAMNIIKIVADKMKQSGVDSIKSIKIRVGALAAVEPDSLLFCFGVCAKGTPVEGAALQIEEVSVEGTCTGCGERFQMESFLSSCPECDGVHIEEVTGKELEVVSMFV